MTETTGSNGYVISRSKGHFLCSNPSRLPTFAVQHDNPENALSLMRNILDHFDGKPFSVPAKAGVDIQHIFIENFKKKVHLMSCPNVLPGYRAFGADTDQALAELNKIISRYLNSLPGGNTIQVSRCYDGYQATCQPVLPHITRNAMAPEQAFNDMALTMTRHSIDNVMKQHAASPVIVTGAFHSGTSALALLLIKNGVCMGTQLNYAYDEQDISVGIPDIGPFMGLTDLIRHYYPDRQHQISDTELMLLRDYFLRLTSTKIAFPQWGWKAPPNIFLMPLLAQVFPKARFIQIVRDGRDVALSPHSELPNNDFRKRMYFDRSDIKEWEGIPLTPDLGISMQSNQFDPPPGIVECKLFAYLWQKMSMLGANFGKTLGDRFHLLRYEDLCLAPRETTAKLSDFIGMPLRHDVLNLKQGRIGKFRSPPDWAKAPGLMNAIAETAAEGLTFFGYQ